MLPVTLRWFTFCAVLVGADCFHKNAHIVYRWAETLGSELWELAIEVGRPDELLAESLNKGNASQKYKSMNVRVEEKSGDELVNIISESVGRMLRRKMDAVTCIRMYAEDNADEWDTATDDGDFTYVSGKYSDVAGDDFEPLIPMNMRENASIYREIQLTSDSHFYNIPVNTSFSSVHIPTNVYDLMPHVIDDIKKTDQLDNIFRQNYESDPALSWQYFGSVTGMLRQYPAMQWRTEKALSGLDEEDGIDLYDCRVRSWFIEAATCSKDMVILIDGSGSMTGMGKTIARTTVTAILDTLSNNDFVTLLTYANQTKDLVSCWNNMLIQATPENLDTFKKSMDYLPNDGVANLTEAFTRAFDLLKTYRETRGCGAKTPCNQLVMLVTDGVPGNLTEVFKAWNWNENSTHIPVRVFTYLLGQEVTNVREIQWMACLNRGYYTHVHTLEEVREQVLKYIPVVARPLVLQGTAHPVVWTHAYADITLHKDEDVRQDPSTLNTTAWQEYRLLTSVSTPVFDRKGNRNNMTRVANLLGVAGTDVPIDDIRKLTLPYKLGVTGYAFIVSNNGFVILHPDLRPVHKGRLKLNYNSIDLTEVEILNDGRGPRDPGPEVLALRAALVDHERGNLSGIPVKLHYDNNRRVSLERRDYFYAPLPGTPFGLAIAIPNYATTWIKVGDEIHRNRLTNVRVADYFAGTYWRVHPGWVYCRYHYMEGHAFGGPEEELMHFLELLDKPNWRWTEQYEAYTISDEDTDEPPDCGRQTLYHDDYYCNKELMQLLVFDAKATNHSFAEDFILDDPHARALAERYGVFLRFVATQSGLTRWHHMETNYLPDADDGIEFGDLHRRAVNEPWYKGAIFQNNIDSASVSLTVPWQAGSDAVVTASLGIFPRDGGKTAPAAVVGFQMPMTTLYERFVTLTSQSTNPAMSCAHEWIDCYLLDQNGYIVISEGHNDTGQFMGTQEGAVMTALVGQGAFYAVDIYDYQASCEEVRIDNMGSTLMEPFKYIGNLLLWFLIKMTWVMSQFVILPGTHGKVHSDEDDPEPPPPPRPYLYHYPCDQKRTLYMMNQTIAAMGVTNHSDYCSRPFYAQKVPHTNLMLLVINSMYPTCYKRLIVTPVIIPPSEFTNGTADKPCHKLPLNDLKRRRLEGCFTEHPLEHEIEACGMGSKFTVCLLLFCATTVKTLYTLAFSVI